MPQHDAF